MRYVNRRRLVIVVVLAALFGAALPLLEWAVQFALPDRISPKPDFTLIDPKASMWWSGTAYIESKVQFDFSELIVIVEGTTQGTPESWANLASQTRGLATEETVTPIGGFALHLIGVPFRGMYMRKGFYEPFGGHIALAYINSPKLGTLDKYFPPVWPTGIVWSGFLGNIATSIFFFAALYILPQYFRTHHRIKRGKCWKCGYLSHGAAECPECGAGGLAKTNRVDEEGDGNLLSLFKHLPLPPPRTKSADSISS